MEYAGSGICSDGNTLYYVGREYLRTVGMDGIRVGETENMSERETEYRISRNGIHRRRRKREDVGMASPM